MSDSIITMNKPSDDYDTQSFRHRVKQFCILLVFLLFSLALCQIYFKVFPVPRRDGGSRASYDSIRLGMTIKQVKRILGPSTGIDIGQGRARLIWLNKKTEAIEVDVVNEKVVSKCYLIDLQPVDQEGEHITIKPQQPDQIQE